ncbi:MAG: gamma-glutamylcyclotransferase [bacterium]|nr:gamma-glutamylcyclotransferase [bacterium]
MTTPANSPCLFVYGTLRSDAQHPLHRVIREHARDLGPAEFQGQLFDLGAYPGVIDSEDPTDRVIGELYEIVGDAQLLFERLDAYEECGPGFAEPTEYLREVRPVRLFASDSAANAAARDGKSNHQQTKVTAATDAWIYLYNHSLQKAQRLVHGDYLRRDDE